MTKEELSRYYFLDIEIKSQIRRLEKLKGQGDFITTVKGSLAYFPYTEKKLSVQSSYGCTRDALKIAIAENIREAEKELKRITEYINSVTDPQIRELLRCRFIDGMTWRDVGEQNHVSEQHARRLVNIFLKKIKDERL